MRDSFGILFNAFLCFILYLFRLTLIIVLIISYVLAKYLLEMPPLTKAHYNLNHKEVLDTFLLNNPLVKPGKMYGHPAYYVGGKLFASLYMDGVCVKVPETMVSTLLQKEWITPFEPMGRKMREWVLITRKNSKEYVQDKEIFDASIEFVAELAGIDFKKE